VGIRTEFLLSKEITKLICILNLRSKRKEQKEVEKGVSLLQELKVIKGHTIQ
jgi:hypothetical protein